MKTIQQIAQHFCTTHNQDAVGELGNSLFISLFGEDSNDMTLTKIHFHKCQPIIAQSNVLEPQHMPPTIRVVHVYAL